MTDSYPSINEISSSLEALPRHDVPTLRPLFVAFSRRLRSAPPEYVLGLANGLIARNDWDCRFAAFEIVMRHKPAMKLLDQAKIEELGQGLDSWYSVDTFGTYLSGPAWVNGQISDDLIDRWIHSPDRWYRRTALVSTIAFSRRGAPGDAARVERVCLALADDRDDMVVKAVSWTLRELTKHNREAVEKFVADHEARLAPRVLRETRHKLRTGVKTLKKKTSTRT